jgi:hypothetical protein
MLVSEYPQEQQYLEAKVALEQVSWVEVTKAQPKQLVLAPEVHHQKRKKRKAHSAHLKEREFHLVLILRTHVAHPLVCLLPPPLKKIQPQKLRLQRLRSKSKLET